MVCISKINASIDTLCKLHLIVEDQPHMTRWNDKWYLNDWTEKLSSYDCLDKEKESAY